MSFGYYRYPTLYNDQLVFTAEDDLWLYDLTRKGSPRRLTTQAGVDKNAVFSPCGTYIAFSGMHEGSEEVYTMCVKTGKTTRVTYLDDNATVVGWKDDHTILFRSSAFQAIARYYAIHTLDIHTGAIEVLRFSQSAQFLSQSSTGAWAMQRHGYREYAYWKRYRGGTAGQLWIDKDGKGAFTQVDLPGSDCSRPVWVENHVFFISDHEGVGNVYRVNAAGTDLTRITHHTEYYVRHLATDGNTLVYSCGGDLYTCDPLRATTTRIEIPFHTDSTLAAPRYVDPEDYLQDFDLHPSGKHVAVTSRGKALHMGTHAGATYVIDPQNTGRFRLARWMHTGEQIIAVNDADGEERLGIYDATTLVQLRMSPAENPPTKPNGKTAPHASSGTLGRVVELLPSPKSDQAIVINHRNEILLVDTKTWKIQTIDQCEYSGVMGLSWSLDSKWIAYAKHTNKTASAVMIYDVKTKKTHQVTSPVLRDGYPSFDPDGKYLYFIRHGEFQPKWDTLHFDMNFPRGSKPYAIVLQEDGVNPFIEEIPDFKVEDPEDEKNDETPKKKAKKDSAQTKASAKTKTGVKTKASAAEKEDTSSRHALGIDFADIASRVLEFPVPAGEYTFVFGLPGKVMWGTIPQSPGAPGSARGQVLHAFDFESKKPEVLVTNVIDEKLSTDHQWLIYADPECNLRVLKAGEKPDDSDEGPSKKTGWINMDRLKIRVDPQVEWQQIFDETWRLQRDNFWIADMSKIDWMDVYTRYQPLVSRVRSRAELTDLLWEVQGELGTSHAYVFGGDEQETPKLRVGKLGADYVFDAKAKGYRITKIYAGNIGKARTSSPLIHPGVRVKEGDVITEINGLSLSQQVSPRALLLYQAGHEVRLTVVPHGKSRGKKKPRYVTVRPLATETPLRYREWVEANRAYVHAATKGKVGYVHIPDMGKEGFAEFHQGYLNESDRDALIIDVRFNGGGNVSALLMEKLTRQRLGYDLSRWNGVEPYPAHSPSGAMVALTNEYAGSDGDMFSHSFKMLNLGPLIGRRTWGGVVGISPRHGLADRGMTTQPEFSFWFKDVGWGIENYGVDPDIDVDIMPHDYANGKDPQLDRGIAEALKELKTKPPLAFSPLGRPDLGAWKKNAMKKTKAS